MEVLLILLLGGGIAFCWWRIEQLERRLGEMGERLAQLTDGAWREGPAEVSEPAETPSPQPAKRLEKEVEAQEEPEPELAPEPEPATEPAERALADPGETQSADASEPDAPATSKGFTFDFEDIFGRRLPIWGGGFALAIAGIFLVRFSIEAGLLTPGVRVALSFLFGIALTAAAEAAFRFEERLRDPRVRQALAGAGLATLYGAFYLAGSGYDLIGAGLAFLGLAVVTAAAIGLSFRFGLPSAVIGLVGGFAAPLMVNSDSSNVPLLSFYLALVTGGLAWAGQAQGRNWLGLLALGGALVWGALMIFTGLDGNADFAAVGGYLIVLGSVLPGFLRAKGGPRWPVLAAGAIATLQMAVLVGSAEFAPLTWGLYLLIGAALAGLGWRFKELRAGTLVAAGLALWLLMIWPDPDHGFFAMVTAAVVAIFALVPLAHHWFKRGGMLDLAQLSITVLGAALALAIQLTIGYEVVSDAELGLAFFALALIPALAFALMWQRKEESATIAALIPFLPAWLLGFCALLLFTPGWLAPVMGMIAVAPTVWCYSQRNSRAVEIAFWIGAIATVLALCVSGGFEDEILRLVGGKPEVDVLEALVRWTATAAPFAAMAWLSREPIMRAFTEVGAVLFLYGAIAQVAPMEALPWIAAVAAIGIYLRWGETRIAARASALAIAGLWAVEPVAVWVFAGTEALIGTPFPVEAAIAPLELGWRVLPILSALALIIWKGSDRPIQRRAPFMVAFALIALVALHSLFKQIFGISAGLPLETYGMAERTIWQALLTLAGFAALKVMREPARLPLGIALIGISLAHFAWFSLLLHNPMLVTQHVGSLPVVNWLLPSYGTAIAGLWLIRSEWKGAPVLARVALDAGVMALIALLSVSLLRQVFAGTILTSTPIGQTESLLISLTGIVLALAFLWWGSRTEQRSWRIGSLVLMLAAVIKVFLIDAAGLEGLLRVASFMALGFSLIGIGWVYTKQLAGRASGDVDPEGES